MAHAEEPPDAATERPHRAQFAEDFSSPELDVERWVRTKQHDFSREAVEVVDGRLLMAFETLGTDPRTVKFHGVRTADPVVDLAGDLTVEFELDWNDQANGSYMRAGVYLCPIVSDNPREENAWLRMIYVGVPPGRNARALVSQKVSGTERVIRNENWPREREGRLIGRQRVMIALDGEVMVITENERQIYRGPRPTLAFDRAYLYLQHSSHSNYSMREIFFDNVVVTSYGPRVP